ncbi:pectinesterase [Gracilibacillus oryzae]|uniref:Pectinesterase n=1 Tax=Gracilibacillus oryzae TaxID=1672701 RepID=A0A7C8KT52_9BACI|nr:pectinesterase [Gracilibacillus oryzae]KAB8127674.1 pectinesterase [Gracilibacillus oryzae]
MKRCAYIVICLIVCFSIFPAYSPVSEATEEKELLAFPGAEGFGQYSKGGRGGEVYHVTSYELTGPGTFHDALTTAGDTPRTIVFDISGEITIPQIIVRNKANITIAGQTAPGDGVTIKGNNVRFVDSHDIIIRYMRFRLGKNDFQDDALYFEDSQNIIIDHSSFSWGTDENLSILSKEYENPKSKNITVQWSIISEGLLTHSMGGLIEMNPITMHHNLYAHNNDRNPKTKGQIDFVNNVVYNWGGYPYVAGGESGTKGYGNVVGNYFIAGINSANPEYAVVRGNENYSLYLQNNRIDSNKNGILDGRDTGTDMMEKERPSVIVNERFAYPLTNVEEPEQAYEHVLGYAGASLVRDTADQRVVYDVRNQTGAIIGEEGDVGGYPVLEKGTAPADTDRDGMPDEWELANGLNPNNPEDRNGDNNNNSYTNLEEYLNELAAPAFPENYPMEPPVWNEDPFVPPVVQPEPKPEQNPEPALLLDGEIIKNVVINDNSGNGAENASKWSVEQDMKEGDLVAGDRSAYRFTSIPSELQGVEWIRSAVNSRSATSEDLVSFYLTADAYVYVAHDSRISSKPEWLSSYENTGQTIQDDQPVTFELYRKHYPAGTQVVMGPNNNSKRMNYFVLIQPADDNHEAPSERPSDLAAEESATKVSLNWSAVDGASGYLIYRSSSKDSNLRAIASSDTNSFTDNGVELGVHYHYRISAINSGGESALSDSAELFVYDQNEPAPVAPNNVAITETKSITVGLEWEPVEEAISYSVYRSAEPDGEFTKVASTTSAVYTDKPVEPSTTYYYKVATTGIGGESEMSGTVSTTTKEAISLPGIPNGLTSGEVSTTSLELKWEAVVDAESYDIYRKANSEANYSKVASINKTFYKDTGVSAGQTGYSYKVVAGNEMGESGFSEELYVEMPLPDAPSELKVTLVGEDFVGLTWTSNGGADQYNIYRKAGEEVEHVGYAKVDTFYDRTAEPGVNYTYYVKAAYADRESESSNSVEAKPGYLTVLTHYMQQFEQSGDLVGPAVAQLNNSLKQVDHHLKKDSTKQASKFLSKYTDQLDRQNQKGNISPLAKSLLLHYADAFLEDLNR